MRDTQAAGHPPSNEKPMKRFEYKHSLKKPFYIAVYNVTDNTHNEAESSKLIPHFTIQGNAGELGPKDASLRLLPPVPRARGLIASSLPLFHGGKTTDLGENTENKSPEHTTGDDPTSALDESKGWEINVQFSMESSPGTLSALRNGNVVSGNGQAMGLALMISSTPPKLASKYEKVEFGLDEGEVDGLLIKVTPMPTTTEPNRVMIEGTLEYPLAKHTVQLGSCYQTLRNHNTPVVLGFSHSRESTPIISSGLGKFDLWTDLSGNGNERNECFSQSKVVFATKGEYFAMSAMNGEMDRTDSINIFSVKLYSLDPPARIPKPRFEDSASSSTNGGADGSVGASPDSDAQFEIPKSKQEHIDEIEHKVQDIMHKEEQAIPQHATSVASASSGCCEQQGVILAEIKSTLLTLQKSPGETSPMGNTQLEQALAKIQHLQETIDMLSHHVDQLDTALHHITEVIDGKFSEIKSDGSKLHSAILLSQSDSKVPSSSAEGIPWIWISILMLSTQAVGLACYIRWKSAKKGGKKYL
jgi:hypothetical protein